MRSPMGLVLKATGLADKLIRNGESVVPVARGLGLSAIPKPERFYFGLGAPIETRHLKGRHDDEATLRALRDQVRDAVEAQIAAMKAYRQDDPKRGIVTGWLNERLDRRKPAADTTPHAAKQPSAGGDIVATSTAARARKAAAPVKTPAKTGTKVKTRTHRKAVATT